MVLDEYGKDKEEGSNLSEYINFNKILDMGNVDITEIPSKVKRFMKCVVRLNLKDELHKSYYFIKQAVPFMRDRHSGAYQWEKDRLKRRKVEDELAVHLENEMIMYKQMSALRERLSNLEEENKSNWKVIMQVKSDKKKLREELFTAEEKINRYIQLPRAARRDERKKMCIENVLDDETDRTKMVFVIDHRGNIAAQSFLSYQVCGSLVGKKYHTLIDGNDEEKQDINDYFNRPSFDNLDGWVNLKTRKNPEPALINVSQKYLKEENKQNLYAIQYPLVRGDKGYIRYATVVRVNRIGSSDDNIECINGGKYYVQDSLKGKVTSKQIRGKISSLYRAISYFRRNHNKTKI